MQLADGSHVMVSVVGEDGEGNVVVSFDGGETQVSMRREDVQGMVDLARAQRWELLLDNDEGEKVNSTGEDVSPVEGEAVPSATTEGAASRGFELNDVVEVRGENGQMVQGYVTRPMNEDGMYEVFTDSNVGGLRSAYYAPKDMRLVEAKGVEDKTEGVQEGESGTLQEENGTLKGDEVQPSGRGVMGNIYDLFRGKAKEAVDFLMRKKEGVAVGALHHREVGDIDLWWGNEKAGLMKIARKHPEVLDNLQGVLDGMRVVQASDNRVILESDTHKAVVSNNWLGEKIGSQWLLTAYEKKGTDTSGGSIDIVPEPNGKQNGTAPLQDVVPSDGKDSVSSGNGQGNVGKNVTEMPMRRVKRKIEGQVMEVDEEDFEAVSPERTADYLYNEEQSGISREQADDFVGAKIAENEKVVKGIEARKPRKGASPAEIRVHKGKVEAELAEAVPHLEYWRSVAAARDAVKEREIAAANERYRQERATQEEAPSAVEQEVGEVHAEDGSERENDVKKREVVRLSDEIDENGRQFVLTHEGELAFGEINEETGLAAAPILLSEGMITNAATNDGYGLVHIEARHGNQIRGAGYKSVIDFVETVAKNYDVIKEGNLRKGHPTYRLQLTDEHNNTLMVELSGDGTYWNINTAGVFKSSYGKKNREVYNRHTTAKQPAEAAETSQDAEQGDTQTSSRMVVPTSSEGKVSTSSEKGERKVEKKSSKGNESTFVGLDAFTDGRMEEELKKSGYASLEEWEIEDPDAFIAAYDAVEGEYASYVSHLAEEGALQEMYDRSSVRAQNKMRKEIELAGFDYHDLLDTSPNRVKRQDYLEGDAKYARGTFLDGRVVEGEVVGQSPTSITILENGRRYTIKASDVLVRSNEPLSSDGSLSAKIAAAEGEVDTNPSDAQKEAGNYKKGHVQVGAFDISIEQPKGSVRRGVDANGKAWESKMHNTYGYFRGTEGVDGDHIDVFVSNDIDGWNGQKVFVVDQYNPDGTFDEHKVMLGFNDAQEAMSDYLANYEEGWKDGRRLDVSAANLEDFEKWLASSHRKTKPFGEYKGVKRAPIENEVSPKFQVSGERLKSDTEAKQLATDVVLSLLESADVPVEVVSDEVAAAVLPEHAQLHMVYHGSGAKFDKFDHSHMGEGEGAQAFGWGSYVTEVEEIGRAYAQGGNAIKFRGFVLEETHGPDVKEHFSKSERKVLSFLHKWIALSNDVEIAVEKAKEWASNEYRKYSGRRDWSDQDYKDSFGATSRNEVREWRKEMKEKEENARQMLAFIETLSVDDFSIPPRHLYTVEIPDDRGKNYLHWDQPVAGKEKERIRIALTKAVIGRLETSSPSERQALRTSISAEFRHNIITGQDVYYVASRYLSPMEASGLLSSLGYTGISHAAQVTAGERADGARNYAIFKEHDLKITNHVEFMKTSQGTVYGWTVDGKIYLTRAGLNPETPIHEYTHLWAGAMRERNAEGWKNIKDLLQGSPVWEEVMHDPNYSHIKGDEDAVASEVLSRISGKENAKRFEEEAKKVIDETRDLLEKARAVMLLNNVRRAVKQFWNWVGRNLFEIKRFASIEEVTDRVLYDLASKTNLKTGKGHDKSLIGVDNQGNLVDGEGRLVTEKVGSIDELRDEDFTSPSRSVELPELDTRVADAIGTGGKPVVIKKNIFERNAKAHGDLTPADSRDILKAALYTPTLYGRNQKTKRPYNWVLIKTRDAEGENRVVLLEVNENKDNVEIVHWHYLDDRGIAKIKRQAVREDGHLLILPSEDSEEAGALSSRTNNLSSEGKDSKSSEGEQEIVGKNGVIRLQKGDDGVAARDAAYADAVARGDMETAERMLAEEAELRDGVVELMRNAGIDVVVDSEEGQRVLDMENGGVRLEEDMEGVNARFNDELGRYQRGEMGENEMFHLGIPEGVMRGFLPELPIVMRQRVVRKASEKKHDVEVSALRNMPKMLAAPIFVFQRDSGSLGVLTEMNDRKGRNVFVAFALQRNIQDGGDVFEVNDIRSIHGREHSNIIEPIKENGTLKWVDKEKGLNWLSSASSNYQQEIDSQDLSSAAKVVKDFENPKLGVEKRRFFRTEDGKAYGFTVDGKVYLDPRMAGVETAVHEYTHLWADALRRVNPAEWRNVVELMKGTSVWDEVKRNYPELESEDEIADEVLAHYSGRRGAERLRAALDEEMGKADGVFERARVVSAFERVKRALARFWKGVADFLGVHFDSADEVADMVLEDLLRGRKLDGERGASMVGRSLSAEEAKELVSMMEENAAPVRELELTRENWAAEFGADGVVQTPLGEVKMGEHQYEKLEQQGRRGKLGMVKPTLESPDVVIEDKSRAKEGEETERGSSYVFVKSFVNEEGKRQYFFTSVTVHRNNQEVVISNQEKTGKRISNRLQQGEIGWINEKYQPASETQGEEISLSQDNSWTDTSGDKNAVPLGVNLSETSAAKVDKSSENGKGKDIFSMAERIAEETKREQRARRNARYHREGGSVEYGQAVSRAAYEQRMASGAFQSREALQDSMLSLREAMDLILHKGEKGKGWRVEDVSDLENAYMGENRLSSVNSAEQEAFTREVFKPMLGAVAKLAETEEERMVLTDYLMAKHGLERNRVMAEREGLKAYETYVKKHPESEREAEEFIAKARERDYAGLTALTGVEDVMGAEMEAAKMVEEFEEKGWERPLKNVFLEIK